MAAFYNPASASPAAPAPGTPLTAVHINAERLATAVDDAYTCGVETGFARGYVAGVRYGRLVMLLWGAGAGALLTLALLNAPGAA